MGLDMYLTRKMVLEEWENVAKRKVVEQEVAYWRKANMIHNWFINTAGNGDPSGNKLPVTIDQLEHLQSLCLFVIDNPELASEKIPTVSGFFFGDTEYGEWYFEDLKDTVEKIEKVLHEHEDGNTYEYDCWW